MQTETAVRRAPDAQAALIEIAKGIDQLRALLVGRSDDAWLGGAWPQHIAEPTEQGHLKTVYAEPTATADLIRIQLAECTDGDERRALEAKLRLLTDDGTVPTETVPEGARPEIEYDDGMIVLPPASAERKADRAEWLKANAEALLSFYPATSGMTMADLTIGYIQGGPLWLYYQDNQLITTMPAEWRRTFVDDIAEDSPAAAQEIARDILKDTDPAANRDVMLGA